MKTNMIKRAVQLIVISAFLSCLVLWRFEFVAQTAVDALSTLRGLPLPFSPSLPGDINAKEVQRLQTAGKFDEAQRLFDIFAWQTFIALNWPADKDGRPDKRKVIGQPSNSGVVWEFWKHEFDVYTADGQPPKLETGRRRHALRKTGNTVPDILNESLQAFKGPLVDQNGNWVHYEIRLSQPEVDYLIQNNLYYIQGQVAFNSQGKTVSFPASQQNGPLGAMELKAAWKVLDPNKDIESRFFTVIADIVIDDPTIFSKKVFKKDVKMGLVGFHISTKTAFAKQWVWATFEQVDNLQAPPLTVDGKRLMPSFYNPNRQDLPVNIEPPYNVVIPNQPLPPGQQYNGWDPTAKYQSTQVLRFIPIPMTKQELNSQVQRELRAAFPKSVWQYYELIDTQRPTNPSAPPTQPLPFNLLADPNSVTNKAGGMMTPTYLTNSMMETYFQAGNQAASAQIQGMPAQATTQIFGTESCVGCHSSAAVVTGYDPSTGKSTYGSPLSGDFSWLLQQQAQARSSN